MGKQQALLGVLRLHAQGLLPRQKHIQSHGVFLLVPPPNFPDRQFQGASHTAMGAWALPFLRGWGGNGDPD